MKILLVDDAKTMRMILGRIFKELNWEVFEAGHGKEGMQRLQEVGSMDLALVDWNMPEMNGYEFVQAVRAQPEYNGMKIMMVTTEAEMDNVTKAMEAGANEYMMKPFNKEVVLEKLQILGF